MIKVGDSLVAGNNITSDRIVRLLKGKQQSKVYVTLKHQKDTAQRELTRDIIPIYSVEASIMLDAVTGFIKINRFSATTYAEFTTALKKLKAQDPYKHRLDYEKLKIQQQQAEEHFLEACARTWP